MTIGRTTHPYEQEIVPEGKRLRMKDWLKSRIGDPRYPGLVWLDKEKQLFRIPWKHAALHGWDQNSDGALFRDWAEHTGACIRKTHPKQLKATFRCALHSLPDVHEERTQAKKRGDDACRVYRFESTSTSSPRRRHIRIRNHKDKTRKRNALKSAEECCYLRNRATSQSTCPNFSSWNSTNQQEMFQVLPANLAENPVPFNAPHMEFPHEHFTGQRPWTTQSDPNIPHGLTPPQDRSRTGSMENAFPCINHFGSMHQSMSVPEISPSCFSKSSAIYENQVSPAEASINSGEDHFCLTPRPNETSSFFLGQTLNPTSPVFSTYSPSQASETSPSLPSPGCPTTFMNSVSLSNHADSVVAHATASTSGTIVGNLSTNLPSTQDQSNSPYFGEKLVGPWDAVFASGAVDFTCGMPEEISRTSETITTPLNFTSSEDFLHTPAQLRETSDQTGPMQLPLPAHVLSNVSPQSFSSGQGEYMDSLNLPCQYATGSPADSSPSDWIPSPHHESLLPAACTLLPTSNSPTSKKSSLKWISSHEQSTPSQSPSFYDIPQYGDASEISFNDSEAYGASLAPSSDLNSSAYGGYCNQ